MQQVVICGECGERSPAQVQFCGRCGAFLEWEAGSADPQPDGVDPPAGPGSPAAGPSVGTEPPPGSRPSAGATGAGHDTVTGGAAPDTRTKPPDVAASAPALPTARQPTTPAAVRPGEVHARRHIPVARAEPAPLAAGERPCPRCGVGNLASRRFCRSCGSSLAEAAAPVRPPGWWRRLLGRLRPGRQYEAGTRRKARGTGRSRRWVLLVVAVVVVLLAVALIPTGLLSRASEEVRDRIGKRVAAPPVAFRASSVGRGAPAEQVADGASNRYWAPAGNPVGAWVEVDLTNPVRLVEMIITSGASAEQKQFRAQGRPREVQATFVTGSGAVTTRTVSLGDRPGGQSFAVKVSDVVRVRLTIRSTYGMPPGPVCALGELELYARG